MTGIVNPLVYLPLTFTEEGSYSIHIKEDILFLTFGEMWN
jgi:hypothetical protein